MSSPTKLINGLALCLALSAAAFAEVKPGQPFPDLATHNLEGTLPAYAGQVVLVDFWATWCAPCKASFPAYDSLQRELGDRGLTIIGVSVDKEEDRYTSFVEKFAPGFATLRDAGQR